MQACTKSIIQQNNYSLKKLLNSHGHLLSAGINATRKHQNRNQTL